MIQFFLLVRQHSFISLINSGNGGHAERKKQCTFLAFKSKHFSIGNFLSVFTPLEINGIIKHKSKRGYSVKIKAYLVDTST